MNVSPQQVYQEVLAQGGTQTQAEVAAALVSGIESNGDPQILAGGRGPAQGLFQFEPGTWTGGAGGGRNGLPSTVGAASWQQQVTGFINASRGNNFHDWGPDLVANGGDPNSTTNANYSYSGGIQPGSKVANRLSALNLPGGGGTVAGGGGGSAGSASPTGSTTAADPTTTFNIPGIGTVHATAQQADALVTFENNLNQFGFTKDQANQLTNWAWGEASNGVDPAQISLDFQNQPAFIDQFPGFAAANDQLTSHGNAAMSVADYQKYQTTAIQLANAAGFPPGFINKENIGVLAGANVSTNELNSRINDALSLAYQSTPDQQTAFNNYFGLSYDQAQNATNPMAFGQTGSSTFNPGGPGHGPLTPGQIAAIALDPKSAEPLIKNQITAAQLGGAYQTAGLSGVDAATAMQIAQSGVTHDQIMQSAQKNAVYAPLQTALPGQSGATQVTANQLATGDLLGDTNALRALQVSQETRIAPFKGGGGDVSSAKGVVGAGSASGTGTQ